MRLATIRTAEGSQCAARQEQDGYTPLPYPDLGALLADPSGLGRAAAASPAPIDPAGARLRPPIPRPGKILCVGQNYRAHIAELGRETPTHPTLFAKYPEALIGPDEAIMLPPESTRVDWEAELALVIGRPVRRARGARARAAIAGFTVLNDTSMRDWQWRTAQWLQGKTFERSTPLGPVLVTPEELGHEPDLDIVCEIDGHRYQQARTGDLVFGVVELVEYLSTIVTLQPGDVIATGTPGGVGAGMEPPRFLQPGTEVVTRIEGIGELRNRCEAEPATSEPASI